MLFTDLVWGRQQVWGAGPETSGIYVSAPGKGWGPPSPHLAPRSIRKAALSMRGGLPTSLHHSMQGALHPSHFITCTFGNKDWTETCSLTPTFDTQPRPSKCPCSAEWGKVPFANYMPVVPGFACDEKLDIIGQLSPACGSSSLQSYAQN